MNKKHDDFKYLKIGKKLISQNKELSVDTQDTIREALQENKNLVKIFNNTLDWSPTEHDYLKNILELPKNNNGYYIDSYGKGVSYNGIRTLRRSKVEFNTSKMHKNEIEKCRLNYKYFRTYYCLIVTKEGLGRPDSRPYQETLEAELLTLDDCVILYPRQSGKTVTSGTYLLWLALFHPNMIMIGIIANRPKTAREVLDKIKKIFLELPIWMKPGIEVWNKSEIEFENGTRIMTDSPSSDSFRGYTCNIIYVDETAYINKGLWDEFVDSVMPTMNSLIFKQVIMTSTANGMNHFEQIVRHAKLDDTPERFITCSWRNVPHYNKAGVLLDPDEYKKATIKKYGKKYFMQTEECEFLGSSDTLVGGESLKEIEYRVEKNEPIQKILNGLNIYKDVQENHTYILSVDSSKDGIDDFSIAVTDVSKFPFEQVATANLQVDYITMPEHLDILGKYYNTAMIIVENNEGSGQSITDTLWGVYEYENLYRDKNIEGRIGFKKYTGFRTTVKSRALIVNLLKLFIEEGKLIINSAETLKQLYTFTKNKKGKFIAEDGYKDDAVMTQAIMFAPFMENKRFDNYLLFVKELKTEESQERTGNFLSTFDIGSAEDGTEDYEEQKRKAELRAQFSNELGSDYSLGFDENLH